MSLRKGVLVVIEGVNGAGKTSIINELIDRFDTLKIPISVYKFPNRNGPYGSKIDQYLKGEILIESKYDVLDMFAADRLSVKEQITTDIRNGKIVICDRYVYSAIAYHIPLSVETTKSVRLYCNILGYFDKTMPMPDMIYLIEGAHLMKRGIVNKEVFHYVGEKSNKMSNMLHKVIASFTQSVIIIKNKNGYLDTSVNQIFNDIMFRC